MNPKKHNYSLMTLVLFWCGLVILMSMYITIPLTSVFVQSFHISSTKAAWIGSSFSLSYALGCLLYGPFSDRYGRKIFLVASMFMLAIVTIVITLVDGFYGLIALRGLQGLVAAAFVPVSLVYSGEMFPSHKKLTAIGFISSGLLMAGIAGQVFSGFINEYLGWHAIFWILGIVYVLTTILVIRYLPKDEILRPKESIFLKYKQMTKLLTNFRLLLVFSITFMLLLTLVGMYTILGDYLSSDSFGLTNQEIQYVRIVGIVGMLFSPFVGKISKKVGAAIVLRFGLLIATASLFALSVIHSLPLIVFLSVVIVAGISLASPVLISFISQQAGNSGGSAISFNAFILFLGASTGPILASNLLKTEQYFFSFRVLGFIFLIGLVSSCFLRSKVTSTNEFAERGKY
ncbi:MFS transporter [Paenibacillus taichungensis]|uniref:MFS transporter n=1 Tax=Paenibacillus taichungensis TaxID=484184 RepID=A0ABX2MFJ3_9BACL|nr:MFS transporter [Paenibacillus taichungensis]